MFRRISVESSSCTGARKTPNRAIKATLPDFHVKKWAWNISGAPAFALVVSEEIHSLWRVLMSRKAVVKGTGRTSVIDNEQVWGKNGTWAFMNWSSK